MKTLFALRNRALPFVAAGIALTLPVAAHAAPHAKKPHTARVIVGNGQPLHVMVMFGDKPVTAAHIAVSVSDGSVVLRGLTRPDGSFDTHALDQGVYNVTATTAKGTATGPVTIGGASDPATVSLTLAPKH